MRPRRTGFGRKAALILAGTYAALFLLKSFLLHQPRCSAVCALPDSTWDANASLDPAHPECLPLSTDLELASKRFSAKDIAPLWYRTSVRNATCAAIDGFPLQRFRYESLLPPPTDGLVMRFVFQDEGGGELDESKIMRSASPFGKEPVLFFAPEDSALSDTPAEATLLPGQKATTGSWRFLPQRILPSAHERVLEAVTAVVPRPVIHRGYQPLGYVRFTRPGRYRVFVEVSALVRARKIHPRFEKLPSTVKRALRAVRGASTLGIPIPAPRALEESGRLVVVQARSSPVDFEVLP